MDAQERGPEQRQVMSERGTWTHDPARPWAVACVRADGRERLWMRYRDRTEAEAVAARLCEIGCPARCVGPEDLPLDGEQS